MTWRGKTKYWKSGLTEAQMDEIDPLHQAAQIAADVAVTFDTLATASAAYGAWRVKDAVNDRIFQIAGRRGFGYGE